MTSDFYFFDQNSRVSHIGGIDRSKRNSKDYNQALHQVNVALSMKDDDHSDQSSIPSKKQKNKQTDDIHLHTTLSRLNTAIISERLTKELDTILQTFDEKSRQTCPSSSWPKFPEQEINNEEELINSTSNLPKVSLPGSLIRQLHSTWLDLIENTNYKYQVWRTKAGEEAWHQYVKRKRLKELNPEKQEYMSDNKSIVSRRTCSRISLTSIKNLSHRQSITTNPKTRVSRSPTRGSRPSSRLSRSPSHISRSPSHLSRSPSRTSRSLSRASFLSAESIKNGIHVEFKLSTQNDETKQQLVSFDVPKSNVNLDEDIIFFTQYKCKRLLAETKQKILETTNDQNKKHRKRCRIWFYGDNQYLRKKNNTFNQSNRRQKSKFVLAILRHEIPEKYNIDIDIPETKRKCYVELVDGSTQIYYPSGRLAVLRVRPPVFTTLFFDDTDCPTNQFLGLVTSTGNVLLMQPTFYARFITNNRHEYAYLCNGKTGIIEKQFQYHLTNNQQSQSISIDENNLIPSLFENTIQLQINSFMQLEYHSSSNILFAFTCENEEFKFQLGIPLLKRSTTLMNLTTSILATKKISKEKKFQFLTKNSNDTSNISEKQQIKTQKLSDKQTHSHQLTIMQELILLRKRIEDICQNWLKECRTTLGIMDIDAYCLPDLPSKPILTETKQQIDDRNRENKSAKQLRQQISLNNEFVKSMDRQQQFISTEKLESNVIANVIEQFVPHSDTGQAIKQRIYRKKTLPIILPIIK